MSGTVGAVTTGQSTATALAQSAVAKANDAKAKSKASPAAAKPGAAPAKPKPSSSGSTQVADGADALAPDRAAREKQLASWPLGFHGGVLLGGVVGTAIGTGGLFVAYKTNQGNPPQHEANEGRLEAALTHDTRVAQAEAKVETKSTALFDKQSELEQALTQLGGGGAQVDPVLQPWNAAGGAAAGGGAAGAAAAPNAALKSAAQVRVDRLNGEVGLLKDQLEAQKQLAATARKLRDQNDAIIHKTRYLSSSKMMLYLGGLAVAGVVTTVWQVKQGLTLLGMHTKDHFSSSK